jgi:hypothetical protein
VKFKVGDRVRFPCWNDWHDSGTGEILWVGDGDLFVLNDVTESARYLTKSECRVLDNVGTFPFLNPGKGRV